MARASLRGGLSSPAKVASHRMDRPNISPIALSYEAVLHLYRTGVARRLRDVLTGNLAPSWESELRRALGPRIDELLGSAKRDEVSGHRVAGDIWELLELSDLATLVDRFFVLLVPHAAPGDKDRVMRRVRFLAEERHVLVHRGEIAEPDDEIGLNRELAVLRMSLAKQALRALGLRNEAARVHGFIAHVLGVSNLLTSSGLSAGRVPSTKDYWDFYSAAMDQESAMNDRPGGPEGNRLVILFAPLMQFCQELADELYFMSEDDQVPLADKWRWNVGVEQVALALQDIILHPPWGGGGKFHPARMPELGDNE
jgi:hypothetical protein